ncbi:MAG: hypothetical protein LBK60_02620 [Verrucomicrobiales bacterium]|jgi:hypothetical protein|nr:hypothetical protein [Verrucomicrobiales bacterium]
MDELDERKLGKLLRLKKLETPGKEYFDGFLAEFQRYQRAEVFRRASRWEPLLMWFREAFVWAPRRTLAIGGGCALVAALVTVGVLGGGSFKGGKNSVAAKANPAPDAQVRLVSDAGAAADEQSVPRYSTGRTPLTYDQTIAF